MKKLFIILFILNIFVPLKASESYKDLSREYNRVYREFLVTKIKCIPKNSPIEIFFKDGPSLKGIFKGYSSYDDSVWIKPFGTRGLFSNEAHDVRRIQDVTIIVVRPI